MKERIEKIMEKEQLTASKFADAIGVQRSSISHILSGRNRPSLELIHKILEHFDQLNADWLLLGKGTMIQTNSAEDSTSGNGYSFTSGPKENGATPNSVQPAQPVPVRMVVFYSDNTFEEFKPKERSSI